MDEATLYFSASLDNDRVLCISALTQREASALAEPTDASGYFLYERRNSLEGELLVLARVPDDDAAFTLSRLLKLE